MVNYGLASDTLTKKLLMQMATRIQKPILQFATIVGRKIKVGLVLRNQQECLCDGRQTDKSIGQVEENVPLCNLGLR